MILPGWETSSLGVKDASIKRKLDFCYGAATDCIRFLPFPKIGHTASLPQPHVKATATTL